MKIAFDIDYYGFVYDNPQNKTGIYRVIENTVIRLLKEDVDIRFYGNSYLLNAIAYLKEHPTLSLQSPPIEVNQTDPFWLALDGHTRQLKNDFEKNKALLTTKQKLVLNGISFSRRFIPKIREQRKKKLTSILQQSDIYHSPFLGIGEHIRTYKQLKCFLTVYDLIPVFFPQYVIHTGVSWTEAAIRSLVPGDWVFSISQATKNDLCNYHSGVSADQVIVTHLAASPELFYKCTIKNQIEAVRNKYGIPEHAVYFLGLGNLAPHKNFKALINSFAHLQQQEHLSDAYLVIVGDKAWKVEDDAVFPEVVNHPEVQKRIIFTGRVADEDLSALYSSSLGFVFMSFYEGFGLPPLEAMQCGVPVITSNTSSLPEVVGDAGIMLDPTDEEGLCQAMLRLYNSSSLREEMAQKSLQQAAKFSWDKTVQQTIQGYQRALK